MRCSRLRRRLVPEYFVVLRAPASQWDEAKPVREQSGWDEHAVFMDELAEEGFIVVGGPLAEGRRALHIVSAADEAEIRRRFADDPWEPMEILATVTVERWALWLGRDVLTTADRKLGP